MAHAAPHSCRPSLAEIRASDWLASLEKLNHIAVCRAIAGGLPQVGLTAIGASCDSGSSGRIDIAPGLACLVLGESKLTRL